MKKKLLIAVGALIAYAMVHAPRKNRRLVQYGSCAVMAAIIVAVCVVRTLQLVP